MRKRSMFVVTGLKARRTTIDTRRIHVDCIVDQNLDIQIFVRIVVVYIVCRIWVVEYGTRLCFGYGLVCSAIVSRLLYGRILERLTVK